jgi:hypothetical protein
MNRAAIERIRAGAKQDVELLRDAGGSEIDGPATPMEAYRRAEWFAAHRLLGLCDALLAPSPPEPARSDLGAYENWSA